MMNQGNGFFGRGLNLLFATLVVAQLSSCENRRTVVQSTQGAQPIDKVLAKPTPTTVIETPDLDCSSSGSLGSDERLITILSTNDIHGGVEPGYHKGKKQDIGGMAFFVGAARSIRAGLRAKYTDACAGTVLVDGGDQFQGTLLSNFSEGELVFKLMDETGYDAVVPGNHDYDFGPMGWLEDQVTSKSADQDPRGALKKILSGRKFSLLSANTYEKGSLLKIDGTPAEVAQAGCKSNDLIDWSKARRPDFLKPYIVKTVAGVRVAMIGLDNMKTATMTTIENVTDLCFRDPVEEFKSIYPEMKLKADVVVLMIHDGNTDKEFGLTKLLEAIQSWNPDAVDAVVGGHTHFVNQENKGGVPITQSGANGERFGRINLVFDMKTKKVVRNKMTFNAGIALFHTACDMPGSLSFCKESAGKISYDGFDVQMDASSQQIVMAAKNELAPLASRVLGEAKKTVFRDRINESSMANLLTDGLRAAAQTDIALINTGGIRTDFQPGVVTYDHLFRVIPFNNLAVVLDPMDTPTLVSLIERSVVTCGGYGALQASGLKVTYSRNCSAPVNGIDPKAKLLTIQDATGMLIYDASLPSPTIGQKTYRVATLDFLSSGGSGYDQFKNAKRVLDLGIFREVLTETLVKSPQVWSGGTDGRWVNVNSALAPSVSE